MRAKGPMTSRVVARAAIMRTFDDAQRCVGGDDHCDWARCPRGTAEGESLFSYCPLARRDEERAELHREERRR